MSKKKFILAFIIAATLALTQVAALNDSEIIQFEKVIEETIEREFSENTQEGSINKADMELLLLQYCSASTGSSSAIWQGNGTINPLFSIALRDQVNNAVSKELADNLIPRIENTILPEAESMRRLQSDVDAWKNQLTTCQDRLGQIVGPIMGIAPESITAKNLSVAITRVQDSDLKIKTCEQENGDLKWIAIVLVGFLVFSNVDIFKEIYRRLRKRSW